MDEALKLKEIRRSKQWNDHYKNDEKEMEIDNNNDKEDYEKYEPERMVFPEVNYVNIKNYHRKQIVENYGNFHDKYNYKKYLNSINK